MAVIDCVRAPNTSGSIRDDGDSGSANIRELYTITCDPGTSIIEIMLANGLPRMRDPHPDNAEFRCASIDPQQVGLTYYTVPVDYTVPSYDIVAGNNPLLLPAKVSFKSFKWEDVIAEDADGKPFTNTVGDPLFDELPTRRFSDLVMTIEKNVPDFNPFFWAGVENTTNSDFFLTMPPGTAFIDDVGADSNESSGRPYYTRRVDVHFRLSNRVPAGESWFMRRVNKGLNCFATQDGQKKKVECVNDFGQAVKVPVLLLESGFQMKPNANGEFPEPHILKWRKYPSRPFNNLFLFGS